MIFGIFFISLNDLCYWHDRFIVLFLFWGLQKTMFCLFNKQIKQVILMLNSQKININLQMRHLNSHLWVIKKEYGIAPSEVNIEGTT